MILLTWKKNIKKIYIEDIILKKNKKKDFLHFLKVVKNNKNVVN